MPHVIVPKWQEVEAPRTRAVSPSGGRYDDERDEKPSWSPQHRPPHRRYQFQRDRTTATTLPIMWCQAAERSRIR